MAKEFPSREAMSAGHQPARDGSDPLLRSILAVAVLLIIGLGAIYLFGNAGRPLVAISGVAQATFFVLAMESAAIAFLAFGRYRVLPEPMPFWIGLAFCAYAVAYLFVLVGFSDPSPLGPGLVAKLLNTQPWLGFSGAALLAILLFVAPLGDWPRWGILAQRWWLWLAVASVLVVATIQTALIVFEQYLPVLVTAQGETPLRDLVYLPVLIMFGGGAVLFARRYRQTGDALAGYTSLGELMLGAAYLSLEISAFRFDTPFYAFLALALTAWTVVLFGLLADYAGLYRRERDRTTELLGVLKSSPDAIYVTDRYGRVRFASRMALDILGMASVEDIARPVAEWVSPYDVRDMEGRPLSATQVPLARVARGESFQGEEVQFRNLADGSVSWQLASGGPLWDETGQRVGGILIGTDITDRKQAEAERERLLQDVQQQRERAEALAVEAEQLAAERGEHLEQLQELDRLKDQFIAVAAHELKTPVAIMKGYAQALLRRTEASPPQISGMLEAINRGSDRITNIVQDLLDISRLHAGHLELATERVDLAAMAKETTDQMALATEKHRIRLGLPQPVAVNGDRNRLQQVLINFIDNAIKYSPNGGDIEVAVALADREAVVSVTDHGIGIPRDKQGRIFQRLYSAHTNTPYDFGGMGVGLYISREIVTRHGGRMWFESEEGKGSTFYFSLPSE